MITPLGRWRSVGYPSEKVGVKDVANIIPDNLNSGEYFLNLLPFFNIKICTSKSV